MSDELMSDEELDHWLAEVNEQARATLAKRIDVEAALREVLRRAGAQDDPAS